jgi:hypothetical protein
MAGFISDSADSFSIAGVLWYLANKWQRAIVFALSNVDFVQI